MKKKRCKALHCSFKVEFSCTSDEHDIEIRQRTRKGQTEASSSMKRKGELLQLIAFVMRFTEIIKAMF